MRRIGQNLELGSRNSSVVRDIKEVGPRTAGLLYVAALLAAMPVLSFSLQVWFSSRVDALPLLFRHFTVSYVDWIFVPFNFLVVYAVDWRRGGSLFFTLVLSLVLNVVTHAYWQSSLVENPGHMFGNEHTILPAGWVHLCYSTIEASLILAFLFVRKSQARFTAPLTAMCLAYFIGAGISGYLINKGFMLTDVITVSLGVSLTLICPRLLYGPRRHASEADRLDTETIEFKRIKDENSRYQEQQ